MRNLPLLLVLLLLSGLAAAPAAPAASLPLVDQIRPFVVDEEEEAEEAEDEAEEAEEAEVERELCEEDPELCDEEAEPRGKAKGRDKGQGDECVLKSASANVTLNPGKRRLRLTVHYRTLKPASVSVVASLEGPKGMVHLGTDHARFHRSGVYRDTFALAEKQAKKALGAREFSVELHVVNEPASCGLELTGASRRARH